MPSWSKEAKLGRLINARAETATEKPSFRAAAAKRRCVLPADGYKPLDDFLDFPGRTQVQSRCESGYTGMILQKNGCG